MCTQQLLACGDIHSSLQLSSFPSILFTTVSVPLRGSLGQPCSHLLAPKGPTLNSVTSDSSLISSPALQPLILEEIFPYPSNG